MPASRKTSLPQSMDAAELASWLRRTADGLNAVTRAELGFRMREAALWLDLIRPGPDVPVPAERREASRRASDLYLVVR